MRMIGRLIVLLGLSTVVCCSASAPEAVAAERPVRSLGLAFKPGPCVAGANVVSAAVFVLGPYQWLRYLEPTDGELQFGLVLTDRSESPIAFRWLALPERTDRAPLPPPEWNLELSFNSAQAGACQIRVEFDPSPEAVNMGLAKAEATLIMTEPPPPPPHTGKP